MTKVNPQDGRRYDAETHQWMDVSVDASNASAPAEKKDKPAPASKPKPDHATDTKE